VLAFLRERMWGAARNRAQCRSLSVAAFQVAPGILSIGLPSAGVLIRFAFLHRLFETANGAAQICAERLQLFRSEYQHHDQQDDQQMTWREQFD